MPSIPTIQQVNTIANWREPVLRNLQITQCYYELSQAIKSLKIQKIPRMFA